MGSGLYCKAALSVWPLTFLSPESHPRSQEQSPEYPAVWRPELLPHPTQEGYPLHPPCLVLISPQGATGLVLLTVTWFYSLCWTLLSHGGRWKPRDVTGSHCPIRGLPMWGRSARAALAEFLHWLGLMILSSGKGITSVWPMESVVALTSSHSGED